MATKILLHAGETMLAPYLSDHVSSTPLILTLLQ
jgi:hypothetical protein